MQESGNLGVEDVEADGCVDVGVEGAGASAVDPDASRARAGDVDGRGFGHGGYLERGSEEVRIDAQIGAVPGELAVVWTQSGDVVGGPEVLLGERGVCVGGGVEAAGGIEKLRLSAEKRRYEQEQSGEEELGHRLRRGEGHCQLYRRWV